MSKLHVRHIERKLREIYTGKIDISDAHNETDKENLFLTRSFAAYALQVLSLATPDEASNAIVDGRDDNGIDAIFLIKRLRHYGSFNQNGLKMEMENHQRVKQQNLKREYLI